MSKFYVCRHCGNMVSMINESGVAMYCCGEPMTELTANISDGAVEKHVPDVQVDNDVINVKIGSVEHPMLEEHHIEWICLETQKGSQIKHLQPGEAPYAQFTVVDDTPVAVYEYCNLHGLWKKDL